MDPAWYKEAFLLASAWVPTHVLTQDAHVPRLVARRPAPARPKRPGAGSAVAGIGDEEKRSWSRLSTVIHGLVEAGLFRVTDSQTVSQILIRGIPKIDNPSSLERYE